MANTTSSNILKTTLTITQGAAAGEAGIGALLALLHPNPVLQGLIPFIQRVTNVHTNVQWITPGNSAPLLDHQLLGSSAPIQQTVVFAMPEVTSLNSAGTSNPSTTQIFL